MHHDPLFSAIPHRRTNRNEYDSGRPLPLGFVQRLTSTIAKDRVRLFLFEDPDRRKALTRLSAAANEELYSDPEVEAGSEAWIRWHASDVERCKDGIAIDNMGLSETSAAAAKLAPEWLLRRLAAPDLRAGIYASQMLSAHLIGIIAVRDRLSVPDCVAAGRAWQCAHLRATACNVAARPCNEAIEMIDHERRLGMFAVRMQALQAICLEPDWEPAFLFLMGMTHRTAHPSARRPAEAVILV